MTKTIKRYGATWTFNGDVWSTVVHDRFECMTWRFGKIWQCRIDTPCDEAPGLSPMNRGLGIRIGLEPTDAYYKSMKKAIEWVENYIKTGPKSWKELTQDCYNHWPTLYQNELDIINHIFFCGGNGYGWLDGHIIAEHPEDHISSAKRREEDRSKQTDARTLIIQLAEKWDFEGALPESIKEMAEKYKEEERLENDAEYRKSKIPQPDPETVHFHESFSEDYYNIFCIPDNVADDHLLVCKKAWDFFRYRNSNEKISEEIRIKHWEAFHQRFRDRLNRLL